MELPPTCRTAGLSNAQPIAAQESPRTSKLYDRTQDEISLDEVRADQDLSIPKLRLTLRGCRQLLKTDAFKERLFRAELFQAGTLHKSVQVSEGEHLASCSEQKLFHIFPPYAEAATGYASHYLEFWIVGRNAAGA